MPHLLAPPMELPSSVSVKRGFYSAIDRQHESTTQSRRAFRGGRLSLALVLGVTAVVSLLCGLAGALVGAVMARRGAAVAHGQSPDAAGVLSVLAKGDKGNACSDDDKYAKHTLKLVEEATMFSLMGMQNGDTEKYEASDVIAKGSYYYVICDSSWSIYRIRKDLLSFSYEHNTEIEHMHENDVGVHQSGAESAYEGIYYDEKDGIFYLLRESLPHRNSDSYHAIIEEVRLIGEGETEAGEVHATSTGPTKIEHRLERICASEDIFEGDSKGFEGLVGMRGADGELYLLGLCEGNNCAQAKEGKRQGHGMIHVMKKIQLPDDKCGWRTVSTISLPETADFIDYSSIAYNEETGMVAITSQENSQLWVGKLINPKGSKFFDPEESELDEGQVFDFPRNSACETVYCNIEGVNWISDNMVVTVSDKAKGGGKQDYRCTTKDQSVHVFLVPM